MIVHKSLHAAAFVAAAMVLGCAIPGHASPEYRVSVNGQAVEVLDIPAPSHHDWQLPDEAAQPYWAALFDAEEEVTVRVESESDLSATRILPLSRGIAPRHDGAHALEFTATPPFTISVEPRPRHGALIVSAKAPDPAPPDPGDPAVKWFGPGRHHFDKPIELHSGETLYLAPGAFVEAAVLGAGTNITVRGHGVLSGLCWPHYGGPAGHALHFEGANIALRDFTVVGSFHWTVVLNKVEGATIEGLNILGGHVLNDDGIDVCRSRDVAIRDCFIRTQDDCICAKYWCENLSVDNCALWADVANIFRIGYECDGPPRRFRGIRVRDVDILHQAVSNAKEWQKTVNIQASNDTVFEDFVFDGLRFDEVKPDDRLASIRTMVVRDQWQRHECAGHVRGVTFRNVVLPTDAPDGACNIISVHSHDAEHAVDNVSNECADPRIRMETPPLSMSSLNAPPPYRPVGPETGVRGEATGFFHVENIDGRDWMVDPVGRGVYLAGVDWCMPQGMFCEPLGYAPYGRTVNEKYASRDDWAEAAAARLSSWGFDFLAVGTGPQMRYRSLAHADGADSLYFSTHLCRGDDPDRWISPYRNAPGTAFPNVFHPDFEKACDELARKRCAPNLGDPWLVGYFLDNELRWWGLGDSATGLFDLVRTLPPEHSARQALEAFAAERGGSAAASAATKRAFVALIAERYFSTLCAAIRKADPDHLILGSRFAGMDFAPEILSACGRHCDVVSVNVYPWADLDAGVVLEKRGGVPLADAFRVFREKAGGRPLLLTEWSFPALDSGLPCTYGAGQRFHTQAERARASEMLLRTVMALPFFVGDDFFMWQDDPALGFNKDFHENSNYGLVNVDDEPYAELTAMFARLHAEFAKKNSHAENAESAEGKSHAESAESAERKSHAEFAEGAEEGGRCLSERERFFAEASQLVTRHSSLVTPPSVGFRQESDGRWILSNGLVRLSGRVGGARMADEIAYGGGAPVGRWNALLQWDDNGVTQWTGVSRVTDVDFTRDEATGIGTVTVRAEGDALVTRHPSLVTGDGEGGKTAFAITDRLSLAPGSADILAEIVLLENVGADPIAVEYLFLRPLAAEERPTPCRGATVPNLWKGPVEGWWRLSDGSRWGVSSRDPGVVSASLWFRKEDATQHPDVRCLGVPPFTIAPGAAFRPPLPIGSRIRLLRP